MCGISAVDLPSNQLTILQLNVQFENYKRVVLSLHCYIVLHIWCMVLLLNLDCLY
jgi:hypothetical protein